MEQKIFNSDYFPTSTERELFKLRPSILAIWPVFVAIPLAFILGMACFYVACDVYDHWFSLPEGARDIAWRFASDNSKNDFRMTIFLLLGYIAGVICLVVYIIHSFRAWKEKEIVLTNFQIIYTVKNSTKAYAINQILSYSGGKGYFFRDISYTLNTDEVISVEYVRSSVVKAANNYIDNYINCKK